MDRGTGTHIRSILLFILLVSPSPFSIPAFLNQKPSLHTTKRTYNLLLYFRHYRTATTTTTTTNTKLIPTLQRQHVFHAYRSMVSFCLAMAL
ncbi:hypothetical protein F5H01DRAFT_358751 [Linnemannia elongata]|nr:hypothetical protein F5H01DRAFT_358751 [Linnemannia elongata]